MTKVSSRDWQGDQSLELVRAVVEGTVHGGQITACIVK